MSEINPHPPNPDPNNSDPINPNSMPPPVTNEVVRSKRNTRNSGNESKQAVKNTSGGSKSSLGVKKGSKKGKSSMLGNSGSNMNLNGNGVSNQWPKLSETLRSVGSKSGDTVMTENLVSKAVSFASAFKGLTGYGNNKLTKAYGRASFARVLIEVDASTELVDNIEVCYEKMGKSMNLKVEYAWKPPLCTHCKVFGHEIRTCRLSGATVVYAAKVDGSSKSGEEWQEARRVNKNGASNSRSYGQQSNGYGVNRGGFNGRGRGGMQGRSGMVQRGGNENFNVKYVPVENGGRKIDDGMVMEGKINENTQNKGKGIFGANDVVGKAKTKNVTSVKNTFEVLAKEGVDSVDVGSDEWVQMKSKIDLACGLGMSIAESEKIRWSEDLVKYYNDKCNAIPKSKLMEGLKWRIAKLQKDISYGHNSAIMNAKKM
ncbi:Zinc knuckle CX2CX4HX4C [Artemisia annua]|uniref:Zinc knuckle CX2CX4HX4C n=1 Tax=Artemisia annua TaxID=35608 RepID=A0A2U1L3T7_ARTAN|nr:Zinc knuckle CX2CX4HX4C [Artemisia annua]